MSGRRDSNPLPTAWEAAALPGELLPLFVLQYIKLAAEKPKKRISLFCWFT